MAEVIKVLLEGDINPGANVKYTVPVAKYSVTKSIILVNINAVDVTFTIIAGGGYLVYNHALKANGTMCLNELDIPLLPGEELTITASPQRIKVIVSGFERNYLEQEYPYLKVNASLSSSYITLPANNFDAVLKSLILCNTTTSDSSVLMSDNANSYFFFNKVVKKNDTILVPLPKLFVAKGRQWSMLGNGIKVCMILEKVVQ